MYTQANVQTNYRRHFSSNRRGREMTNSLHNLIAAQGDAVIPNLRYADLAAPTASYVIDKRSTRVPFLAPIYSPNNVSVVRTIIAEP